MSGQHDPIEALADKIAGQGIVDQITGAVRRGFADGFADLAKALKGGMPHAEPDGDEGAGGEGGEGEPDGDEGTGEGDGGDGEGEPEGYDPGESAGFESADALQKAIEDGSIVDATPILLDLAGKVDQLAKLVARQGRQIDAQNALIKAVSAANGKILGSIAEAQVAVMEKGAQQPIVGGGRPITLEDTDVATNGRRRHVAAQFDGQAIPEADRPTQAQLVKGLAAGIVTEQQLAFIKRNLLPPIDNGSEIVRRLRAL